MHTPALAPPTVAQGCRGCPARRTGLCAPLTPDELESDLRFRRGETTLPPGAMLYRAGDRQDACHVVMDGWLALVSDAPDGRRQILDIAMPGALLGFHPEGEPIAAHGAEALTPTRLCVLDQARLRERLLARPQLALRVAHLTACSEQRAHEHLMNIGLRPARARVANLLLELVQRAREGRLPSAGLTLRVPLRLTEIGQALSLSPEHVSRMLADLRRAGVLDLRRGRLRVLNPAAWLAEAGVPADQEAA
jgi:CRP/FNR family transcriptional regulator